MAKKGIMVKFWLIDLGGAAVKMCFPQLGYTKHRLVASNDPAHFFTAPPFPGSTGTCSMNTRIRVFTAEITKDELPRAGRCKLLLQCLATTWIVLKHIDHLKTTIFN